MTNIPPEGDEYNQRRSDDLHAAIANKASLSRRHAEMIRDGAPAEQIAAVIDAIASIEREIPHISKDLAVSVQGRNLTIFLDRMETAIAGFTVELLGLRGDVQQVLLVSKESTRGLKKLERDVQVLKKRMDAYIAGSRRDEVDDLLKRMAVLEAR